MYRIHAVVAICCKYFHVNHFAIIIF